MEPIQYLSALRQWWWVIVASTLIGVFVVVATSSTTTEYTATHDLIYAPSQTADGGEDSTTVGRLAFFATRGEVPQRVATKLGESPGALAGRVNATFDDALGTVSITATGSSAADAERVADTFAAELVASRDEQANAGRQQAIDQVQAEIDQLRGQIATAGPETVEGLNDQLSEANGRLRELTADVASGGLSSVAAANATQSAGTGSSTRVLVGAFVGLLIGAGLALVLTRYDTRIRTKEEAELAFGLPVIAEIPLLSRSRRKAHAVVAISEPESPGAEAYRTLRTSLVVAPRVRWALNEKKDRPRRGRRDQDGAAEAHLSQTVLVVSPGVGEGKSTTVANLAVAFGESGKYVLVLSGDLRRPMVDRYLGVEPGPGMSELLAGEQDLGLAEVVRATSVPDVRMIPSGEAVSNPGELLSHHGAALVEQARNLADVVIVDSPPLLATDDASPLLPCIDDVLIVCRAGTTTAEAARRTSELLNRLGASVAGVALVGAASSPSMRGYYRAYGGAQARARSVDTDASAPDAGPGGERDQANGGSDVSRPVRASDTA